LGPTTLAPARYIRFVYNRVILENAAVRAAAVTALAKFAAALPPLRASVAVLLRRSLRDEDDEVRDRATLALRLLGDDLSMTLAKAASEADAAPEDDGAKAVAPTKKVAAVATVQVDMGIAEPLPDMASLLQALPMSFRMLARSLRKFEAQRGLEDGQVALNFDTLPIVEEVFVPAVPGGHLAVGAKKAPASDDAAAELYKVPALAALGSVFRSTRPVELTESETEYVVSVVKHILAEHVVLEFTIHNTIAEQLLIGAHVHLEAGDGEECYEAQFSISATKVKCGAVARAWVVLQHVQGEAFAAHFAAELKFHVLEVDPSSGQADDDDEGFAEEYPLEDVEVSTHDFMAKRPSGDFRKAWEACEKSGEVMEKFALQFKDTVSAVAAVVQCLGMQPEDGSDLVDAAAAPGAPHNVHLSGVFVGDVRVLARAQVVVDGSGCVLKIAVRSADRAVSQLVADCIK